MKPLQLDWLKHLPLERQKGFEELLRNNPLIFARLHDILSEWEQVVASEETSKDQYETGSWAMLQAHRNGNREIIKKLKDLISFIT